MSLRVQIFMFPTKRVSSDTHIQIIMNVCTYRTSVDGAYEIADADRKTFFTKAGRPVKDGGGETHSMRFK